MSADPGARTAKLDAERSGSDGISVRVRASDGAFYSFHLYRGSNLTESTPYGRAQSHTFRQLAPGTYRCRVFVRTTAEERFALTGEPLTLDSEAPGTPDAHPAAEVAEAPAAPDPCWASIEDLPRDSDYGAFLPAVRRWHSLAHFASAADWTPGVNVISLSRGLHVDLFLGGDLASIPEGRGLPVIFSGAVAKRDGKPGPFYSGTGLGRSVSSPFVAISDATLNVHRELALGWYAGRVEDGLQEAIRVVLTAIQRRYDRELVLVGGSGGGFASLHNAARLDVPVSAFVWNPQTDLLDYQPKIVAQYLTHALPAGATEVATMTREERSEALLAGGVEHRALPDGPPRGQRRVLYLQNASDSHVINHLASYVEQGGLRHLGGGRYADDEHGTLVVVSDFSEGHGPPPREVLVEGLRALLDTSLSAADVVDDLQRRQLLSSTGLETLPRDLRGEADRLREVVTLRATRDESGKLRASLIWDGLPNRYGGISTAFELTGRGEPFTRTHRQNAVLVQDDNGEVDHVTARVRDGHLNEIFEIQAAVEPTRARLRTYVVGSCVSRDTFAFLNPKHFELAGYLARQSLISAFGSVASPPIDPAAFTSPFQRRMLEADAGSALPALLREVRAEVDLVLWDLVDERLGVLSHPGGGVSTDSVELRSHLSGTLPPGVERTPFGSARHLELFTAALPVWRNLLAELGLLDRTVLVAPPWATLSTTGEPTPTSFGLNADEANRLTEAYVVRAQEVLGLPAVGRSLPSPRALSTHQWGLAPFHYDDQTYERLATEISSAANRLCRPSGWDETNPGGRTRIPSLAQRSPASTNAPTVSLTQTGPLEVTATVESDDMQACAFTLMAAGRKITLTPYQRLRTHRFAVPKPDIYRCRAFILKTDGERVPVTSSPLRLR